MVVAAGAVLAAVTQAATIHVDIANCPGPGDGSIGNPYCSIQTAIVNAANTGDEVVVAEGEYFENINFNGKAITVRSTDPNDAVVVMHTIINGGGSGTVVICTSGEGSDTALSGLVITVGNAVDGGGGMLNAASSPTVTNCSFIANTGAGGGMYNTDNSSPTVTNCSFSGNTATIGSGGGMANAINSNPTLTNCTFSGNSADLGGGMANTSSSSPTVTNCVLWGNSSGQIVSFGDTNVTYSDVEGGWSGDGFANIDADPLFIDPDNGDYRLQPGSPCIDAGNNWGVGQDLADLDGNGDMTELTPLDLDGNPRFANDPGFSADTGCGVAAIVDMGAYEYQGVPAPNPIYFADLNLDGVVGLDDFNAVLSCWSSSDEPCCVADLDIDGNVGINDFLILLANWTP